MRRRFITLLIIVLIAVLLALLFFFWQSGSGKVSHVHASLPIALDSTTTTVPGTPGELFPNFQ